MSADTGFSRRDLLAGVAAAAGTATAGGLWRPPAAWAAADMKGSQVPGYFRFKLGEFEITILSDGTYELPTALLGTNVERKMVTDFLKANYLSPEVRISHVNIPLINTGKELVLVDVGGGMNWMPTAGKLTDNLKASGYQPEDVDKVIITHGHPDHIWGIIDEFEEAPRFPKAEYVISSAEWDFWTTDKAMGALPEMFQGMAVGAKKHLLPIAEKTTRIKPGEEVVTGITTIGTPGHTPGHMSVLVESKGDRLLVTADTVTHPFISFERPDWWPRTDVDAKLGEASRRKTLDMAVSERMMMLVYHLTFPGLCHAARAGSAWRSVPATWRWTL